MSKEWIESNYMEALLLGDKHCEKPVREVTVAGYKMEGENRRLFPRCKTIVQNVDASAGEDHLILYRM